MGPLPAPPPTTIQYSALPSETTDSNSTLRPQYRGPQTKEERMLRDAVYGKSKLDRYIGLIDARNKQIQSKTDKCVRGTIEDIVFLLFGLAIGGLVAIALFIATALRPDIAWLKPSLDTIFVVLAVAPIVGAIIYSVKRSRCSKEARRQAGPKPREPQS